MMDAWDARQCTEAGLLRRRTGRRGDFRYQRRLFIGKLDHRHKKSPRSIVTEPILLYLGGGTFVTRSSRAGCCTVGLTGRGAKIRARRGTQGEHYL
jgi:hypothetical protein